MVKHPWCIFTTKLDILVVVDEARDVLLNCMFPIQKFN